MNGPMNGKYDESVRSFAVALVFISHSAYNFVRKNFEYKLPCISTIKNWLRMNNGNPGITAQLLDILEKKIEEAENEGKKLRFCISFDEMDIKTAIEHDVTKTKAYGFANYGEDQQFNISSQIGKRIAKQVLVFHLNCINDRYARFV